MWEKKTVSPLSSCLERRVKWESLATRLQWGHIGWISHQQSTCIHSSKEFFEGGNKGLVGTQCRSVLCLSVCFIKYTESLCSWLDTTLTLPIAMIERGYATTLFSGGDSWKFKAARQTSQTPSWSHTHTLTHTPLAMVFTYYRCS